MKHHATSSVDNFQQQSQENGLGELDAKLKILVKTI
jgi:hypothetical protein